MRPLVSILLPVFNAETTLPACLRSVQRQTEPRWQCIIVDDGSDDDSRACARWFADCDHRFLLVSTSHQGLVPALNTGLEYCHERFIARMDADDLMHRHRLARQIKALENAPDLTAVGCHVRLFPREDLRKGLRDYECWLQGINTPRRVCEEAFVECPVAHPTLMIRSEVLISLGYRDCGWPEDYDLILRLLMGGHSISVVPQRLLSWRNGPHRLSLTSAAYSIERFIACKAAFLASYFLTDTDTYILWGYGDTGKTLRRKLLAYKKAPSYIVELHPGRLGNRIHGAPVIPPEELLYVSRHPIVISVAGEKARYEIRRALRKMGFLESRDFVCAA